MKNSLGFDLRRTVLLGAYMRAWGMPLERIVSRKDDQIVEVYYFPPQEGEVVNRYATVGLSGLTREGGSVSDCELLFIVPSDNGGAASTDVTNFLLDVMAYSLRSDVQFKEGASVPESPLAPQQWSARALLIDEPRGEPEYLAEIFFGSDCVKLWWLVPVYGTEYELIKYQGVAAFDKAHEKSNWSLVDPRRPPVA